VTVRDNDWLAQRFEQQRGRLRAVAFRMLGSHSEADDAVQEAWIRFSRSDTSAVVDLRNWLTTVVSRLCLDMLQARRSRSEVSLELDALDAPISRESVADPEDEAVLADSIGAALLVVLETLAPAERVAFVLHDIFAVSFDEIAQIISRNPAAARQMASRARRRVQGRGIDSDSDGAAVPHVFRAGWGRSPSNWVRNAAKGLADALQAGVDNHKWKVYIEADAGSSGVKGWPMSLRNLDLTRFTPPVGASFGHQHF